MTSREPPEGEAEWWAKSAREKRSTPLAVVSVLFLVAGGGGAYAMFGRTAAHGDRTDATAEAGAPSVIVDPVTLLPIALHKPTPMGDEIFSTRMLRFTIALDQASKEPLDAGGPRSVELAGAEAALREAEVPAALGPGAATALREVLTTAKAAARAAPEDDSSVTAFEIATARLDDALIASGLPYFVDASVIVDESRSTRLVLLYEFAIASSDLHASGEARVRAVQLRRLDRLNWSHTLLGFVNPHRPYAVVLLDQIDEQLVNNVLPALAPDAAMPLMASDAEGDSAPVVSPPQAVAISVRAGKNVRAEVDELLGQGAAAARELGDAVRARRALFEKWNQRLRARGVSVKYPSKLELDVGAIEREMSSSMPRGELEDLRSIQKRIDRPDVSQAYAVLRDAFVASVERHEVQHRLDQIHPITTPKAVDALVSPGGGRAGENLRDHIKNELSAYLAQLARDEPLARTTFTMLLRFLADPRVRGSAESYAALIATEELASELGIAGASPLLHDRLIDDARVDLAHRELTTVPAPKLRDAARKVWSRLYGADLAPLTRLP